MLKSDRLRILRGVTSIFAAVLLQVGISLPAFAQEVHRFDIDTTDAAVAIHEFGNQSGVQILASGEVLRGKQLNRISGELSTDAGFQQLLAGTGLSHRYVGDRAVAVVPEPVVGGSEVTANPAKAHSEKVQATDSSSAKTPGKPGFWDRIRLAQNEPASGSAGSRSAAVPAADVQALGEVTVTAQRRAESAQDVPVSLQAFSNQQIEVRGIQRVENIAQSAPNVVAVSGSAGQANGTFIMRGIPGTGVFIDGVWQQSAVGVGQRSVAELDRVEVLRGPQGTLFGRDSTGGAIRMWTKPPADEFGVRAKAIVGSYDRRDLTLNADLPVGETLKTKVSFSNEQRDGYVKSILTGQRSGKIDDQDLRADVLWEPVERFALRLTADKLRSRTTQPNAMLHIFDPGLPGVIDPGLGFTVPTHQYYEALGVPFNCQSNVMNCPGGQVGDLETVSGYQIGDGVKIDFNSYSLRMDFNLTDQMALTNLTNYQKIRSWSYSDYDVSNVDFFSGGANGRRGTWSNDLQFTGDIGRFHWVAGSYWWQDDNKSRVTSWALWDWSPGGKPNAPFSFAALQATPYCQVVTPPNAACARLGLVPQDTMSWTRQEGRAFFGELSFDITSTLSVTVGSRNHHQENTTKTGVIGPETAARGVIPGTFTAGDPLKDAGKIRPVELEFSKTTYRFALTNKFNEDLMAYVGYSEGYNSGGVSRINIPNAQGVPVLTDFPYDPQTIKNYEIGLRSDWFDNTLRVNLTYFRTYWNDIQLAGTVRNPLTGEVLPTFLTQNAAKALAKGGEVELLWRPISQLTLNADLGLLDTAYVDISSNVRTQDLNKSSKFGGAPEFQYKLGAQWTQSVGSGDVLIRADYNHTSGYQRNYVPGDQSTTYTGEKWEQPAYGLLQARIGYVPASGTWDVAAFGTNLTDERYSTGGFMSPLLQVDAGTIGRPREYGLQFNFYFK